MESAPLDTAYKLGCVAGKASLKSEDDIITWLHWEEEGGITVLSIIVTRLLYDPIVDTKTMEQFTSRSLYQTV